MDFEELEHEMRKLRAWCVRLEAEVRELRALLTPLDPGSLPPSSKAEVPK